MNCSVKDPQLCLEHHRPVIDCIKALQASNSRLNLRCQAAESAAQTKVEEVLRAGPSLGRALAGWAAGDYRRRLEEAEKKILSAETKRRIMLEIEAIAAKSAQLPCSKDSGCECVAHRLERINALLGVAL
jgi:hypothetical protein